MMLTRPSDAQTVRSLDPSAAILGWEHVDGKLVDEDLPHISSFCVLQVALEKGLVDSLHGAPGSELPKISAFLSTRKEKGAVEIEGKKWAVSIRNTFPSEPVWRDVFNGKE